MPLVLRPGLTIAAEEDTRARGHDVPTRWACFACGHEWPGRRAPRYCRECGVVGGYAPELVELVGSRSDEIEPPEPGVVVEELRPVLPMGLPLGRTILFRGRPGAGKSRTSFRVAGRFGRVMAFGIEMGKVLSLDTAIKAGAIVDDVWWYEDLRGLDELEIIDPAAVVLDSIQKLKWDRRRVVDKLMSWAVDNNRNLILVSQLSADGKSRYGEDDDFDVDIVVDVSQGRTNKGPNKAVHLLDDKQTPCKAGHAHCSVMKSRICQLLAFDVPIVARY